MARRLLKRIPPKLSPFHERGTRIALSAAKPRSVLVRASVEPRLGQMIANKLSATGERMREVESYTQGTPEGAVVKISVLLLAGANDVVMLAILRDLLRLGKVKAGLVWNEGVVLRWQPNKDNARSVLKQDILVRETQDGRGRGAYAARRLRAGEWLGDYEGDKLTQEEFFDRYPDGLGDYCISSPDGCIWDGFSIAQGQTFTLAHINHSQDRWNVIAGGVGSCTSFYTCSDIEIGDELLLNYGRKYWLAREGQELP
mmetsp:Transcript_50624/g.96664  ORF Transcript_50624/g.96664 Transcript_50624/m.96664 type:complete len:257 (+) Transcript_50624:261-1031(+)|eukprot:CAMPEP_0114253018 /NCGR_PEP_ID=MMETSP0058-20121206/16161_1 /TAXON_ID=36894 /ORGANISM="Pyramimonas parkeae, CCMP726" /LENGTH=256 /DNA_ID=CAMNT_0001367021 /DNA_START=211 /DNA_END=981 /DNA_ORIENTATION=-